MTVSADAPYLDMAYKLVRYAGRDALKISPGKETWAGEKQVYRQRGADGRYVGDVLALRDEPAPPGAEPLLELVMERGRLTRPLPPLPQIRAHCATALGALPESLRQLSGSAPYRVVPSDALAERQRTLKARAIAAEVVASA